MRNNIEDVLDQPDRDDREILSQVFKNDKNKQKLNVFIYLFHRKRSVLHLKCWKISARSFFCLLDSLPSPLHGRLLMRFIGDFLLENF